MENHIGIWINNRKALIVTVSKGKEEHEILESHASRHIRFPGEPKGMSQNDTGDTKYHEELRAYFKEVLGLIREAETIFIFGPGTAKDNLKKMLMETRDLGEKIVKVEPADKMTAKQIVAKVKEYFFPKKSAAHPA